PAPATTRPSATFRRALDPPRYPARQPPRHDRRMTDPARPPLNLRAGFWALFGFAALGLLLESLHAFKAGLYLDVPNDTRRLLWRLAHAHGALLGLLNVVYTLASRAFPKLEDPLTARALLAALALIPL